MGGRLALRKLNGYQRAVIVSARVRAPEPNRADWSSRFESERWDTLMRDWNAQPIFGGHVMPRDERDFDRREITLMRDWNAQPIFGGHVMPRDERDFDRRELVRQLRQFAPSAYEGSIDVPTLFVAGERDPKYVDEVAFAVDRWPLAEG